jgi:hypothetical protein
MILASANGFLLAAAVCWATPLWYPLYRLAVEARQRRRGVRVRQYTLLDWLNATGCGTFAGSLLFAIWQVVTRH